MSGDSSAHFFKREPSTKQIQPRSTNLGNKSKSNPMEKSTFASMCCADWKTDITK